MVDKEVDLPLKNCDKLMSEEQAFFLQEEKYSNKSLESSLIYFLSCPAIHSRHIITSQPTNN